jgi:hypothetical protein
MRVLYRVGGDAFARRLWPIARIIAQQPIERASQEEQEMKITMPAITLQPTFHIDPTVVNVDVPQQAPPVVNFIPPEQRAAPPVVLVSVPEQKRQAPPIINVNVPQQPTPDVIVNVPPQPVTLSMSGTTSVVERDSQGRIVAIETKPEGEIING